jgi:hypothetical protein
VTTRPGFEGDPANARPTFLTGIVRADVERVVVDQPQDWPNAGVYDRERGSPWGTFELSLMTGRDIDLTVLREGAPSRTVHIDQTTPGERLIQVAD